MSKNEIPFSCHSKRLFLIGLCSITLLISGCASDDDDSSGSLDSTGNYQIWASDQSNSVAGIEGAGTRGNFLWVWDASDIETQIGGGSDASPPSCLPDDGSATGPCDVLDVFPQDLVEVDGLL